MILPKKLTEKEIWKSNRNIDKERYLDSEGMRKLADLLDDTRLIMISDLDDNPCCAYNRDDDETTCNMHRGIRRIEVIIKFLRDDVELRSTDPRKQVFGDEK